MRSKKKILDGKLLKAWALAVKERADFRCEVCGSNSFLNSHHIEGKRNRRLRWDIRNGVCLCSGCHIMKVESAHQSPEWFHFWLEEHRWEDLQYIMCVRNEIVKWSEEDMLDKLEEFKNGKQ